MKTNPIPVEKPNLKSRYEKLRSCILALRRNLVLEAEDMDLSYPRDVAQHDILVRLTESLQKEVIDRCRLEK